jgi:hypothetical protein
MMVDRELEDGWDAFKCFHARGQGGLHRYPARQSRLRQFIAGHTANSTILFSFRGLAILPAVNWRPANRFGT